MNYNNIMNIVLITSVIHTVNAPLSYHNTRSIYTPEERFRQTLITIKSVEKYIPNAYIILIELSKIDEIKEYVFRKCVNLYLNYSNDEILHAIINGPNKSFAEGSILLKFFDSDEFKKLDINNLFKISGRYHLKEQFNLDQYMNNLNCFKKITMGSYSIIPCYYTFFFKINKKYISEFINIFKNNIDKLRIVRDTYHSDIEHFICTYFKENIKYIDTLGISGNIAVTGEVVDC